VVPTRVQFCAAEELHVHSWIFVPSAVPALLTSRHLPPMPMMLPAPEPAAAYASNS
jgi:hypothetical protein